MSGLHTDKSVAVPLTSIFADVHITDYSALVTLTQTYKNYSDEPIEATYDFPITESSAVTGFAAKINDKIIRAEIKENEEAKQVYDDTISSGHGAYLLQQTSDDVFTMSVGNLPPATVVEIEISYICELNGSGKEQAPHVLFNIPTTILKPYTPPNQVAPHLSLSHKHSVKYTFDARVRADMHCGIQKVNCTTHSCNIKYPSPNQVEILILKKAQKIVDKGFGLEIHLTEPHKPRIWSEKRPDDSLALMLVTYPNIKYKELATEIIFVVDRSGSMGGNSILEARTALKTCLKMLPQTVLFNIVGFGSSFNFLFKTSQQAKGDSLKKALTHTNSIQANLGGTDILPPFLHIYQQKLIPGTPRNIFVLTDGGVGNTDEVKKTVQQNSNSTRVFSFGIGSGVSEALVKGVARLGKGKAVFIRDVSDMKEIVSTQLHAALQPAMTDSEIEFNGINITQIAPSTLPPIFNLEQYIVYAFSEPNFTGNLDNIEVTLSAIDPNKKKVEYRVKLAAATNLCTRSEQVIQKLAARSLIQELEEASLHAQSDSVEEIKQKIIDLGLTYSLATKHTSFIAVEERDAATVQHAPMTHVNVPLPIPSGTSSSMPMPRQVGGFARKVDSSLYKFNSLTHGHTGVLTRNQSAKLLQEFNSASRKRRSTGVISIPSKVSRNLPYDLRNFPSRNMLQTSVGIPLTKSPLSFSDPCISFALKGPVLDSRSFTCWLDASLAFIISITPLRECVLTFTVDSKASPILMQLSNLIDFWVNKDNENREWRHSLMNEYQRIKEILETFGFSFEKETSPAEFIQFVNTQISKVRECPCMSFPSLENFSNNLPPEEINYVIIEHNNEFPKELIPRGWKICSLIHMSSVECRGNSSFCGHFSMFSLDNSPPGYVIYDSMLTLHPGNFQGGFVSENNSVYSALIEEIMDSVVVCCLRRK